jgi:hypothetical protein
MRRRRDAILPHRERLVCTLRQLLGTSSPRKMTLTFVAAGLIGVALIFVLLEISVRNELAKERTDAVIGAITAPAPSPEQTKFEDMFPILSTSPTSLESVDPLGALAATPFSDHPQTFGQVSRERAPLPRPRKRRR